MKRHNWALMALNTTNAIELIMFLKGSVQECYDQHEIPYMDPAVRLIAHQVAFALNGDTQVAANIPRFIKHCQDAILAGPNYRAMDEPMPGEEKQGPVQPPQVIPN